MTVSPLAPRPLVSVQAVLRSEGSGVRAQVAALPHVVQAISGWLDYSLPQFWTLPRACAANFLSLLPRLAARGVSDGADPHYWMHQCAQGLVFAVKNDNVAMAEWLHNYCPSVLPYAAMIEAAKVGSLRMLEWLTLRHEKAPLIPQLMDAATSTGQLETLQWLHDHAEKCGCTRDAMLSAIHRGDFDTVKWLHEHVKDGFTTHLLDTTREAVISGDTRITQFLYDHPDDYDLDLFEGFKLAVENGDLKMAQWLRSRADGAIDGGSYRKPIDCAARGGHLHIVQWLHEQYPHHCTPSAMDNAARCGSLEVIKWLHENRNEGCTEWAMNKAASKGHLEVVKWLHENRSEGCSAAAMDDAASHGHLEVVKWLHENRTEGCTVDAMDGAASHGHLETVTWLHANRTEGCTASAMDEAAQHGHLEVIRWLHENRTEGCTTRAMDNAAENGHLGVLKWLHENRREGCTADAMAVAAECGHFEVLLFLHANRSADGPRKLVNAELMSVEHLEIVQWLHGKFLDALNLRVLDETTNYMSEVLRHTLGLEEERRSPMRE
ncbi:hypothetical protein Gpo141_00005734 [Globisporangium polare]